MKKQERINRQEEMLSLIEQWQDSGKPQQVLPGTRPDLHDILLLAQKIPSPNGRE